MRMNQVGVYTSNDLVGISRTHKIQTIFQLSEALFGGWDLHVNLDFGCKLKKPSVTRYNESETYS